MFLGIAFRQYRAVSWKQRSVAAGAWQENQSPPRSEIVRAALISLYKHKWRPSYARRKLGEGIGSQGRKTHARAVPRPLLLHAAQSPARRPHGPALPAEQNRRRTLFQPRSGSGFGR